MKWGNPDTGKPIKEENVGEVITWKNLEKQLPPPTCKRAIVAENVKQIILQMEEMSIEDITELCRALKCTPNDLYKGVGNMKEN